MALGNDANAGCSEWGSPVPRTGTMMSNSSTRPVHRRVAVVFDFDETLAADSFEAFLVHCGCDPLEFRRTHVRPLLDDGWEEQNAKIYALVQESRRRSAADKITRERIREFAAQLDLYPGVTELFDRLRTRARCGFDTEVDVEYYLVSSGLVDIPAGTRLASVFSAMWGCELSYTESGEIDFVRRVVTHFGKTRYLRLITRAGPEGYASAGPQMLYRTVPDEDLHVPFGQLIYVGDGSSDIPAFALVHQEGGIAIGVRKPGGRPEWQASSEVGQDSRVDAVASADYGPDSAMTRALDLAVDKVCAQIALRGLGASGR